MMWKEVGLIGRDKILRNRVLPRILACKSFVIIGEPGIGKSALLQWGYEHDLNPHRAIVVCSKAYSEIIADMCDQIGIDRTKKKTVDLETELLQNTGYAIYLDDLHRATPKLTDFIKALRDRHTLYFASRVGRLKENINQVLWGVESIRLDRLDRKTAIRIVSLAVVHFGCKIPVHQVVSASSGVPGKMHRYITTGDIPREDSKMRTETFDLAPVFLIGLLFFVLLRYVGRATDATDLVMIGGFSMVLMIVVRGIIAKGSK